MDASIRLPWVRVAILAGIAYLVIGRAFAWPTENVQVWRYAAWAVSGVVFATHIGYEQFNARQSPLATALHTALGVAIGGFGLAVVGALNSLIATSALRPVWLLALVLWPATTALPAFVAAFVVAALLARLSPST